MFESGLEYFHIRKPKYSKNEMIRYIELIPYIYRNRLILHTHHELAPDFSIKGIHIQDKKENTTTKIINYFTTQNGKPQLKPFDTLHKSCSIHSLQKLEHCEEKFDYVFLSPVFDSISKRKYKSVFKNKNHLKTSLSLTKQKVIALGGIELSKIKEVVNLGFAGIGILGAVWNNPNPLHAYQMIKNECETRMAQNIEMNVVQQTYRIKHSGV